MAILLAVMCAGGVASAGESASLQLAATRGVPGMSVRVGGTGFPAGSVAIAIDSTQLAVAAASGSGSFDATVVIPDTEAVGAHLMVVSGSNGPIAQADFEVEPVDPSRFLDVAWPSKSLAAELHTAVYLPPGYDVSAQRYPVVYFLHGLPAGATAYRSWEPLLQRALAAVGFPAIGVIPQASTAQDPDPEFIDRGGTQEWETALGLELPRFIDGSFRTIASRSGRALVGVSAGGYGAMLIGLHHLDQFSALESWSGYFEPTNPAGTKTLDLGSARANRQASAFSLIPGLRSALGRMPTFIGFYVGRQDSLFRSDNVHFHQQLVAAGVRHTFAQYAGGHTTSLWSGRSTQWLAYALSGLARSG